MTTSAPSTNFAVIYTDLHSNGAIDSMFYGGGSDANAKEAQSIYCKEIVLGTWSTHFTLVTPAQGQPNCPSFRINRSVDINEYNIMVNKTPSISVKPEYAGQYRIAWTRNLGHNIAAMSGTRFSGIDADKYDSITMDNWFSYMVPPGKWKVYNKTIGNLTSLVEFSNSLPSKNIITWSPEWYEDDGLGLPMCALRLNEVEKYYVLPSDWSSLLRVQKLVTSGSTSVWTDIDPKTVPINDIIRVNNNGGSLAFQMPTFYSHCAQLSRRESNHYRSLVLDFAIRQFGKYTNGKALSGTHTTTNWSMRGPVRAIFFSARNVTASSKNILSNYTTNPTDYDGEDPITSVSLQYDGQSKFDNMPSFIFSDVYPIKHAVRCPQEAGYHIYPLCSKMNSPIMDGSTNFDKIDPTLICDISDDPENEGNVTTNSEYSLEIRWVSVNYISIQGDVFSFAPITSNIDVSS